MVLFSRGGMHGFFSFFGYNEIRSMSGPYASYWNAFLYFKRLYNNVEDGIIGSNFNTSLNNSPTKWYSVLIVTYMVG